MLKIKEGKLTPQLQDRIHAIKQKNSIDAIGQFPTEEDQAFYIMDGQELVGATTVTCWYKALHIKQLYISQAYRHQGIGTHLLNKALTYGKASGCKVAYLFTMNTQALSFYEKLGFQLELTRDGYAQGRVVHYLKKDL